MFDEDGIWQEDDRDVEGMVLKYYSDLFKSSCPSDFAELLEAIVPKVGKMEGVAVCRGAPILSHLFFANDSLIFCKASLDECDSLQRVLKVYEDASGQQLNRAKTSLFFSSNTDQQLQEEIKRRKNWQKKIIGGIPLSNWLPEDKQTWAGTLNGLFSVRSAYKVAMDLCKPIESASSSNGDSMRQFWKKLWKIQIPHKIRHFIWRAANDILPTKANLVHRHVILEGDCEECGDNLESLLHLCWECPKAHETWRLFQNFNDFASVQFRCFMDFLWFILMKVDWLCEDQAVAITILWALWKNRNDVQHGGLRKNGKQLILWCTHYLEEYWAVVEVPMKLSQVYVSKWERPAFPFYKVNVDGAVFKKQKEAGVGVVIRDHFGNFIASVSKKFQYPLGAIEVEAKAFESGLEFAKDMGCRLLLLSFGMSYFLISNPFELINPAQIKPPLPPQQQQPPPPKQPITGYEKQFVSNKFLVVMQEMIRKEVRNYMPGIEQNGLCNLQTDAIMNAVIKRIGISKIE
ncbi:hypothetical protein SO802_004537 [Lithocarpus litseifolius]|uniref:Reverse transcriptase zinc-binding domain-containing protein n=1 Tax=Lithocarpus litseifolius TaxID=425828 RepID=A0AAW2E780_9ROSI